MSTLREKQTKIKDQGKGLYRSWIESIKFKKGDSFGMILLKLMRAVLGSILIILFSPIILFLLIVTILIAL